MISRNTRTQNNPSDTFETSGTNPYFKLSAAMVELSLREIQRDSFTHIPATFSIESESHSSEARVWFISMPMVRTVEEEESKAAQLHRGGMLQVNPGLVLRSIISRISNQRVRVYTWLRTRTGILQSQMLQASQGLLLRSISPISGQHARVYARLRTPTGMLALALFAFPVIYAVSGHHPGSLKSRTLLAKQPERPSVLVTTASSELTHDDHAMPSNKAKPRRHQGDYVAKDRYVYYGKNGKPSH